MNRTKNKTGNEIKNGKRDDIELEIKEKVEKYLKRAEGLFENLEYEETEKNAKFHEMTFAYYHDAKYFYKKKEYINALASLEYAEGWLDAGKFMKIFKEKNLFS